ncbi:MAG: SusD/RagB family nutrient-binding outer membrane lipoprotein [Chitinophagales bacterium]
MKQLFFNTDKLQFPIYLGRMRLLCIACFFIFSTTSCRKDFEEINKNPNGFTTASDGSLFNSAISSLQSGWNEQLYVNISVVYKETQLVALPQVRWNNYTLGTEEIWTNYYTILPNLRELEKRFQSLDTSVAEVKNMMAMEKIILAYKTFKVTDLFGDIPFSEAGYGFQDVNQLHPKFDAQESIYKTLLNELQWASQHLDPAATTAEPFLTFKNFDNLFFGDVLKWQKFANSLRLRYAMRMVNKEPILAGDIIKEIFENQQPVFGANEFGQLNNDPNECAALYPYQLGYRNESKGWSFNQSKDVRMGTNIWHLLSKHDSTDGSGIFDPRAYYFFETNNKGDWVAFPNDPPTAIPDGGIPYEYHRDLNYTIKGADCLYSPVNYYIARDMDYQPDILITGAEVLFIRAEAYLLGIGVAKDVGTATSAFLDGIQFSISFWEHVMNNSKLPPGAPFSNNITVPSNLNFFSVQNNLGFFTGGEEEQLKEIYEQCWIDMFRQPQEAFALARRTVLTPHEGNPSEVYRFPIPPSEVSYNEMNWMSAIGSLGDNLNEKVWWMK